MDERETAGDGCSSARLEAVETIIYLSEIRIPGRSSRTRVQELCSTDEDIRADAQRGAPRLLSRQQRDYFPTLVDPSPDAKHLAAARLGCKMATGSGKTVVMAMLICVGFLQPRA